MKVNKRSVETFETFDRLTTLPHVQITRFSDGRVSAFDMTETGAPLCHLGLLLEFKAVQSVCNLPLTPNEQMRPDAQIVQFASFYARNMSPQRSVATIKVAAMRYTEQQALQYQESNDLVMENENPICIYARLHFLPSMREKLSIDGQQRIDALLALDRLPVAKPCVNL